MVSCCVPSDKSLDLSEPVPPRVRETIKLDNVCGTFFWQDMKSCLDALSLCK